eukprot:TRINITY_DN117850_c0_g1_i1.p1 TRINITY_DN117850_c0_g1~~TRINITY_DN117850_c0_g1_i1.p1  ORF type:complete len:217 (+),score=93.56 TRINITY_DN117850_c0_g1_i1:39-689(+)
MPQTRRTLEEKLEAMGGQLFVFPLVPSVVTFIFSVVSSVVLTVSSSGGCSDALVAYMVGIVVLGYSLSLYYGFSLVGQQMSLKTMVFGYAVWVVLMGGWNIFGTIAVSESSSACRSRSVFKMAVGLIVIFWLCILGVLVPPLVAFCRKQYVAHANKKRPSNSSSTDAVDDDVKHDDVKHADTDTGKTKQQQQPAASSAEEAKQQEAEEEEEEPFEM